jgi:gliding motility-associated-like protein
VTVQGQCGSVSDQIEIIDCVDDLTVTLNDETICPGENAILQAQVFGGLGPFTFDWSLDLGSTAGPFTVSPAATTTYSVTVTDAQGTQVSATATVTVTSENLSVNLGPDQELCNPPIVLDATNADAVSYTWSTGATSPVISVDQAGIYSVTVQGQCGSVSDQIEIIDCVDDLTVTLNDETICPGDDVILQAQVFGGLGPFTFDWSPDLGNTAGPFTVSPAATTTYSVTVTDAQGTQVSATATVTVTSENLSVNLGPDQVLCNPPIVLDATNADAVSYTWSTGATSPVISVDQAGIYSITVQGQCGSASDQILIEECIQPLSVEIEGNVNLCPGESTILTTLVGGGVPPYEYFWSPIDTTSVSQIEVSPDADSIFFLTVTDANGNQAQAEIEVFIIAENLELNLGSDIELCEESLILNAFHPDAISYLWSNGETSAALEVFEPGIYSVEISGQCESLNDEILIESCNELNAIISSSNEGICPGDSTTLSMEISGGNPPYDIVWNTGDDTDNLNVSPDFSQAYEVVVTDSEGNTTAVSTFVQVLSTFVEVGLPDSLAICSGDTINLNAEISTGLSYAWSTGSTNPAIEINQGGNYVVEIETACEVISEEVMVIENNSAYRPVSDFQLNPCEEDGNVIIGIEENENLNPLWLDNINEFTREISESGEYVLISDSPCGKDSLKFLVNFVDCECDVYVPNAFTPDADGLNDLFKPSLNCEVENYRFRIFNRWGDIIFESNDAEKGWNGSSPTNEFFSGNGVYIWQLSYSRRSQGSIEETFEKQGSVVLIR